MKCVICMDQYHPDWMMEKKINGDWVKVCAFCLTDKKVLTVKNENDVITETVEKKQASRNYMKYLDELSKKPEIAKILSKEAPSKKIG